MRKFRICALLLCAVLCLSCLSPAAFAETEPTESTSEASAAEGLPEAASETAAFPADGSVLDFNNPTASGLTGIADYQADAKAAMLIELQTNSIAYAMNPDERLYPASLTKVMTCLLALEHGNLDDMVTASAEALADLDASGSGIHLLPGETMTLHQLLYGLMVASANDGALVIAEHIGGTIDNFVDMMNEEAQRLGCTGTHFANPHGLHDENHYSTARDMARIFQAALEYEEFREIYQTNIYTIPATNLSDERIIVTTDYLTGTAVTSQYYDSRVTGGKTGFTTPAGRCVICTAESKGLTFLCVIMGAENITEDGGIIYTNFLEASELLDFGFNSFVAENVLSPLSPVAQLGVADAVQSVVVTPEQEVRTLLPKDYDPEQLKVDYSLSSETGLVAPLTAGQVVGTVEAYYCGTCVASTNLVTMTAVERHAVQAQLEQTAQKISNSPWKVVMIITGILLAIFLILVIRAKIIRHIHKKRRAQRRRTKQ